MCGIAGLIYRSPKYYQNLGLDLLKLIQPLETRGPDSCGVGIYGNTVTSQQVKFLLLSEEIVQWESVRQWLVKLAVIEELKAIGGGVLITLSWRSNCCYKLGEIKALLAKEFPSIHLMSVGQQLEIYKEVGTAAKLFSKYNLEEFVGSHGIAHTRMATESVVDTYHSHPFTSASDLCIVHNGQISNYYKLRFKLEQQGIQFETNNDSEAIAHYIRYQLLLGQTLEESLQSILKDFDGTYTFLVATSDTIGLVRDRFAAKPAVIYESEEIVAIASEYRCFLNLPNFNSNATICEPDAGEINIWSVTHQPQVTVSETNLIYS